MACERIRKLLGNNGPSKSEDDKQETTRVPLTSTTASSGTSSTTASMASLNDFQKKIISNYESHMNKSCSFKKLPELNPNIVKLDEDILYHIALGNKSHDLQKMFKDVKFVVMGGTPKRMEHFAYYIMNEIGYELPPGTLLNDISKHSHRYAMYKVGPVMSVSHGMGMPSIGILLHELIKLVHHAGMVDPIFVRIGTCGGFSRKGGTVVVSDEVVNDYLESIYELSILGTNVRFPAALDQNIASELAALADPQDNFETIKGKTYCTDSFYDGSGRADGAVCEFSNDQGMEYYKKLESNGVVNVEMESLAFAALTCRAGIKSAVMAVILSDRLETDQIKQPKEVLDEWKMRPQKLLARYIKKVLASSGTGFVGTSSSSQGTQRPAGTVATPGVTPSGRIICPPLSCGRKPASAASQPSAAASSPQPPAGKPAVSSSCKPVCEKRPIPGLTTDSTAAPTKSTSATDSVKTTTAATKADSQGGWRSCYKACGIGSEQVDASTPQATTVKPTISAGVKSSTAPSKGFDCACASGKIAEPGKTPMVKPTSSFNIKSSSEAPSSGSTTSGLSYKAKDFDSSTKSTDPNDSKKAYYKECIKYPKCDEATGAQKKLSGTFETPIQEKTKGTAATALTKPGETRPCCIRRGEDMRSPRTQVAEQQKYIEDRLEQEAQSTPAKSPARSMRRSSMPQPVGNMELGPCCSGKVSRKTPKDVGGLQLGPCCTGEKNEEDSPECSAADSPDSDTFASTHSDKSDESPPLRSTAPLASSEDKGREIPSDCPLVLRGPCNTTAYSKPGLKSAQKPADPSPETPDPRQGTKGPIFSTTPMPGSNATQDPSATPAAGSKGSCCGKLAAKNAGTATLPSTTARAPISKCDGTSAESKNHQSTTQDQSNTTSQTQSTTHAPLEDRSSAETDCAKLLKSRCNYEGRKGSATKRPSLQSSESTKAALSTPMPGSKADPGTPLDPSFATPIGAGSCCIKSSSRSGGVAATLSSTTAARKSGGPCCYQFSSNGSAGGLSKPTESNLQPKSAAPSSRSSTDHNKYDESPSPCAACKKYQDSKIIFTGGTPSASQPEIIKCPHKLKRLKDECQGYD